LQQHGSKRVADKVLWNMIFSLKYILFAGAPFYKFVRNRKKRVEKVRGLPRRAAAKAALDADVAAFRYDEPGLTRRADHILV
jgi:hypothetical protein